MFQGRVGNPSNQAFVLCLSPADNNSSSSIPSYIARFLAVVWYYSLSFSVFIQGFRSCQVIAVHLLLASNRRALLQMFCFWQVTPCSSSIHGHLPQIHIRVLGHTLFLRFRFRSGLHHVYFRVYFFQGALRCASRRGEFLFTAWGPRLEKEGIEVVESRNVKSKRRGNAMERSCLGA
jgi:hypothetical protein